MSKDNTNGPVSLKLKDSFVDQIYSIIESQTTIHTKKNQVELSGVVSEAVNYLYRYIKLQKNIFNSGTDEYFMRQAVELGFASLLRRNQGVGAVLIISYPNRIIRVYHGLNLREQFRKVFWDGPEAHAEQVVLRALAADKARETLVPSFDDPYVQEFSRIFYSKQGRKSQKPHYKDLLKADTKELKVVYERLLERGGMLYSTLEPCISCAGKILMNSNLRGLTIKVGAKDCHGGALSIDKRENLPRDWSALYGRRNISVEFLENAHILRDICELLRVLGRLVEDLRKGGDCGHNDTRILEDLEEFYHAVNNISKNDGFMDCMNMEDIVKRSYDLMYDLK
jgi:tRNA(Arg) A34 adenosine deaminase TadA